MQADLQTFSSQDTREMESNSCPLSALILILLFTKFRFLCFIFAVARGCSRALFVAEPDLSLVRNVD